MSVEELVRSWKEQDYRLGLRAENRPEHPAGDPESETYRSAQGSLNTCESPSSCHQLCSW